MQSTQNQLCSGIYLLHMTGKVLGFLMPEHLSLLGGATCFLAEHMGNCTVQKQYSKGPCCRKRRHMRTCVTTILDTWVKKSGANMYNQGVGRGHTCRGGCPRIF